jgi:ElaB/YqjD/DUF883 family membrane-anchored ribosome-binding protein
MSRAPTNDPAQSPGAKPKTESEYLKRQADAASEAMNRSLDDFKSHLTKAMDLKNLTHGHPWFTLAAGAVAGFAAGATIIPSKRQSALKRMAEIEAALNAATVPPHPSDANGHSQKPRSGFSQTLMHELFAIAKPVLTNVIAATIAGQAAARQAVDKTGDDATSSTSSNNPPDSPPSDANAI